MADDVESGIVSLRYDKRGPEDNFPWLLRVDGVIDDYEAINGGVWVGEDSLRQLRAAITAALGDDQIVVSKARLREALENVYVEAWANGNESAGGYTADVVNAALAALTGAEEAGA